MDLPKVCGRCPIREEGTRVEFDPYVPLDVTFFPEEEGQPKPYWRALEARSSLLELGVSPHDGAISSVTLVSVAAGRVQTSVSEAGPLHAMLGVPCLDLGLWPAESIDRSHRLFDVEVPFRVAHDDALLWISLEQEASPVRFLRAGRVLFGVDRAERLVRIGVDQLRGHEVASLKAPLRP